MTQKKNSTPKKQDSSIYSYRTRYQVDSESFNTKVENNSRKIEKLDQVTNDNKKSPEKNSGEKQTSSFANYHFA